MELTGTAMGSTGTAMGHLPTLSNKTFLNDINSLQPGCTLVGYSGQVSGSNRYGRNCSAGYPKVGLNNNVVECS